ncbi:MAG: hypothetical protein GY868_04080 [Deltaproteobacteria bacterium]|nr:hypothetical protein [Deltaproteobacteria bacterium]
MYIHLRDSINHFLLNKLLILRYHVRSNPGLIKLLFVFELLFIKLGIIYYGQKKL